MPVILLTALGEEDDRIAGLEAGADDYLTKPFSPRELALRVRSVLRRAPSAAGALPLVITVGDLTVSAAARSVTINGETVSLTNREFDLLLFFLTHPGTVFTREELLKQVWQWDFGDLSTVTVHVKRLRSKLGDDHRVQTVWGRGYAWSGCPVPTADFWQIVGLALRLLGARRAGRRDPDPAGAVVVADGQHGGPGADPDGGDVHRRARRQRLHDHLREHRSSSSSSCRW